MSHDTEPQSLTLKRSVSSPGTSIANWRTLNVQNNTHFSGATNEAFSSHCDTIESPPKMLTVVSRSPLRNGPNYKHKSLEFNVSPSKILNDYKYADDVPIMNVTRISAEDLASQLTLTDFPIFAAIDAEEFLSCGWSGSKKHQLSPNIVELTSRFNRVSFWVVQEILSATSLKHRAEVLSHFIKVAKRLNELNNLHSAYAVISSLTSAPIHRLTKTWNDKMTFDRLNELFQDNDNFEKLREHLSNAKTPCIPYLGMYLRDITYIDIAHPATRGMENPRRRIRLDNILRVISEFQRSSYDHLPVLPHVQHYLLSVRYIEELQKFLEDDNYKLSLKLEPPEHDPRQSVFYVRENSLTVRSVNDGLNHETTPNTHSSARNYSLSVQHSFSMIQTNSMPGHTKKSQNFIPGHRKAHSLGTNVFSGLSSVTINHNMQNPKNRCLIDDSVIVDDVPLSFEVSQFQIPTFEILNYDNGDDNYDDNENDCEEKPLNFTESDSLLNDEKIIFQGPVKRKTLMKEGKKPAISSWVRYWLTIKGTNLLYYESKCIKTCQRSDYRSTPSKCLALSGWRVTHVDNTAHYGTFTLSDHTEKNMYKFKTSEVSETLEWCKFINQVSRGKSQRNSINECLINLDENVHNDVTLKKNVK